MRIQIASDLHLEFFERRFPVFRGVEPTDADILILAGDIHRKALAARAFEDWPCPVLLLHGNHEMYNTSVEAVESAIRAPRAGQGRFLERQTHVWRGVRFLGCCLWTDYALYGDVAGAMDQARRALTDHKVIRTAVGPFTPEDALARHCASVQWLRETLAEPFAGRTVVITHHAPHRGSIHPRFSDNPLNPAFVSDLESLMVGVDLWVHGHVHDSFDYQVGRTRVVANPRGYALNLRQAKSVADLVWENAAFGSRLVVDLEEDVAG